jgi:hypothetical protein
MEHLEFIQNFLKAFAIAVLDMRVCDFANAFAHVSTEKSYYVDVMK